MPGLESFSTAGLAVHARLDYWNGLHSTVMVPTVTDVTDMSCFAPSMTRSGVGGLWVAQMYSSSSVVHHAREHVARTQEELFFLKVQLEGSARFSQDGREASLQAGDFTLIDSTRPYHMTFDAPNKMLVFGIPHALLKRQLANPERLVGTGMGYDDNLNSILSDFALRLWRQCGLGINGSAGNLASALLSLVAASYDKLAEARALGSTHLEALRLRIIHHIERHLGDCDLSPASIAAMLATSSRYVHSIFTRGDETVSRYILRRRLEESARLLASTSHRSLSVSAIAFDHGFASCTNFGKVFREHYGMTPTEYRHEHCRPAPAGHPANQQ